MVNKKNQYPVPEFSSLEEEDKFWQTHSPLVEGYKGRAQKKQQNRASFLSIRLTGEELASLREEAIRYGLGSSTYARLILLKGMETPPGSFPPSLLMNFIGQVSRIRGKSGENYLQQFNEIYKQYLETQENVTQQLIQLCIPNLFTPSEESEEFQDKVKTK